MPVGILFPERIEIMPVMDNKTVQALFNDAYNGFFCRWRNNVPELNDLDAWEKVLQDANRIAEKYETYEDKDTAPATQILRALCTILDSRAREAEKERKINDN